MPIQPSYNSPVTRAGLSQSLSKIKLEPASVAPTQAQSYLPHLSRAVVENQFRLPTPGSAPPTGPQMHPPPWPPP